MYRLTSWKYRTAASREEVTTIILPRPPILWLVVSRKVSTMIFAFWLML